MHTINRIQLNISDKVKSVYNDKNIPSNLKTFVFFNTFLLDKVRFIELLIDHIEFDVVSKYESH